MSGAIVSVLLPLPFDEAFDYRLEAASPPPVGSFVRARFGARELVGVVWAFKTESPVPPSRLRPLGAVLDRPPLPETMRRLIERTAAETLAPKGAVLKLTMSVPAVFEPGPQRTGLKVAADAPVASLPEREARVAAALADGAAMSAARLAREAGVPASLIKAMQRRRILEPVAIDDDSTAFPSHFPPSPLSLSPAQAGAAERLRGIVAAGGCRSVLLEGEPGAGKTEVYFEAVAEAGERGGSVLVLLPEIALGAQWLERFRRRFGSEPAVWHSGLGAATRRRTWKAVAEGRVRVLVGARSALFLPFPRLDLVILDEEHDPSFKQEDGVIYDARTVARLRAAIEHCPLILATATPSLETAVAAGRLGGGAENGVEHLKLAGRFGSAPRPAIELIDLRRDRPPGGRFLSPRLAEALKSTVEGGEQALLFLNRRGYAPLMLCRACGFRFRCPSCSAWLTSHRGRRRLLCHHCGYGQPLPEHCPECGSVETLAMSGPGVERIAEEVRGLLPRARTAIMTSDTASTAAKARELVDAVTGREVDILIGTQLIAKGHHFPDLTLVGVVDADIGLAGGDPRAAERSFQLLYQLAGRAGRETLPGRVLLQTHLPDHAVMQALVSGDKERFLEAELAEREEAGMPPFGRLAGLIVTGANARQVREEAQKLVRAAPVNEEGALVLGPAPAPMALLRGRYRERILVKLAPDRDLPAFLRAWLGRVKLARAVRLQIDIDPQSFV